MNGWFFLIINVGKQTSPMDCLGSHPTFGTVNRGFESDTRTNLSSVEGPLVGCLI